ncbi:hypothetical protein BGZ94_007550 [Podila epigama]|nr:hypothetical protein BGZ94_007550 [Podila epigama]
MSRQGIPKSALTGNSFDLPLPLHQSNIHRPQSPSLSTTRKKSSLQVHWHPSVNQHQHAKRTRQTISLLAILAFFSSITLVINHYSGCDFASGKCQRMARYPSLHTQFASPNTGTAAAILPVASPRNRKRPLLDQSMILGDSSVIANRNSIADGTRVAIDGLRKYKDPNRPRRGSPWRLGLEHPKILRVQHGGHIDWSKGNLDDADRDNENDNDSSSKSNDMNLDDNNNDYLSDHDAHDNDNDSGQQVLTYYPYEVMDDTLGGAEAIDDDPAFAEREDDIVVEDSLEYVEFDDDDQDEQSESSHQRAYNGIWSESTEALTEDDYLELEEDYIVVSQPGKTFAERLMQASQADQVPSSRSPTQRPVTDEKDSNDGTTRYMTYLPADGFSNQFFGMLRAIMLAHSLGRTLVLPPIVSPDESGLHGASKSQPWSSAFDLSTFAYLTGVKIVEMQDLRDPELGTTKIEPIHCHVAFGVGSLRPLDEVAKAFLGQWKFEHRHSGETLSSRPLFEVETTDFNDMARILRSQDHERLLCLTNVNKMEVPENSDWDMYGKNMFFSAKVEEYFSTFFHRLTSTYPSRTRSIHKMHEHENNAHHDYGASIDTDRTKLFAKEVADHSHSYSQSRSQSQSQSQSQSHYNRKDETRDEDEEEHNNNLYTTPFTVIHVRGQEFAAFCQAKFQHGLSHCMPTVQELAERLQDVLSERPYLRAAPVYVVTDEDRSQEMLSEMSAMGWRVVDHRQMGTSAALGEFGPEMMDQFLMVKAEVVIGVRPSNFFRLAALRQQDWNGRHPAYV